MKLQSSRTVHWVNKHTPTDRHWSDDYSCMQEVKAKVKHAKTQTRVSCVYVCLTIDQDKNKKLKWLYFHLQGTSYRSI